MSINIPKCDGSSMSATYYPGIQISIEKENNLQQWTIKLLNRYGKMFDEEGELLNAYVFFDYESAQNVYDIMTDQYNLLSKNHLFREE